MCPHQTVQGESTNLSRAITSPSVGESHEGSAEVAPLAGTSFLPREGDLGSVLRTAQIQLHCPHPTSLNTGTSLCPGSAFWASSCPVTQVPLGMDPPAHPPAPPKGLECSCPGTVPTLTCSPNSVALSFEEV